MLQHSVYFSCSAIIRVFSRAVKKMAFNSNLTDYLSSFWHLSWRILITFRQTKYDLHTRMCVLQYKRCLDACDRKVMATFCRYIEKQWNIICSLRNSGTDITKLIILILHTYLLDSGQRWKLFVWTKEC